VDIPENQVVPHGKSHAKKDWFDKVNLSNWPCVFRARNTLATIKYFYLNGLWQGTDLFFKKKRGVKNKE
jgi:hypothetical protein